MIDYPHLASRLFNTPLAITENKARIIQSVVARRFDLQSLFLPGSGSLGFAKMSPSLDTPNADSRPYQLVGGAAIIGVTGSLVHKSSYLDAMSGVTGYDNIRQQFLYALDDPSVQGIVFDCDSPGGECSGCFDLVDTIYEVRGEKPICAILSECAFSAAYAIASAADEIIVPRTGGTGSVGVIYMHADFSEALEDSGVKVTIIKYGKRKADGNEVKPLSDEALARFQADIDVMGEMFVDTVARNRGMKVSDVRDTEASTFLGAAGVEVGFADAVAAPDAALAAFIETFT